MFYVQHAAISKDLCDRAWHAHRLGYSQVLIIASEFVVTIIVLWCHK